MQGSYNKGRGRILRGALAVMNIQLQEAGAAIGKTTDAQRIYMNRVLADESESNPVIIAVTRFVLDQAAARGMDVVTNMIDWADELEAAEEHEAA